MSTDGRVAVAERQAGSAGRRVSIVLPTRNRSHLLGRAVSSVIAQTHADWELVVVDDASTDATQDVIASFKDSRVRSIRNAVSSGGASRARNIGIQGIGPGDFLAFIDDDDEWHPDKLRRQIEVFESSPERLVVVGCGREDHTGGRPIVHVPEYRGRVFEDLLARRARGYGAQQILVRRTPGEADQLFDTGLICLEDMDYAMRLAERGPFDYVPEPMARIYRDDGGPHLWNPETAILGYQQLERKYETVLQSRAVVRAHYYMCMARDFAALDRIAESRKAIRHAEQLAGRSLQSFLWLLGSAGGSTGIKIAERLFPLSPPPEGPTTDTNGAR